MNPGERHLDHSRERRRGERETVRGEVRDPENRYAKEGKAFRIEHLNRGDFFFSTRTAKVYSCPNPAAAHCEER